MPNLSRIFARLSSIACRGSLSGMADIGPGLLLPHANGVVVGADSRIGWDCTIQQFVTVGGNLGKSIDGREKPIIGNRVLIGAGAVVAGPVVVGDGATIGANCVITRDVPAGGLARSPRPEISPRRPSSSNGGASQEES
jgi:serine O-acetyltransferase